MVRYGIAALAAVMVVGAAQAADLSPTDIVRRHTSAGGNLDAIMADYADDAVVLQSGRAIQGKPAIRELFARMFPPRPAGAAPATPPPAGAAPPSGGMNVSRVWEEGNVGFMTWSRGPMNATEEFLVRNGKIQVQVIFMAAAPPPTAKP